MVYKTRSHIRCVSIGKSSNLNAFIHKDLSEFIFKPHHRERNEQDFDDLLAEHRGSFMSAVLINDAFFSL